MARLVRPVLFQAEVTYQLRRTLGPVCAWEDLLADMRSGERSYHGLTLLPMAVVGRESGKRVRPVYNPADVKNFVEAAKIVRRPPSDAAKLSSIVIEIDTDSLGLPWSARRAKVPATPPVATHTP